MAVATDRRDGATTRVPRSPGWERSGLRAGRAPRTISTDILVSSGRSAAGDHHRPAAGRQARMQIETIETPSLGDRSYLVADGTDTLTDGHRVFVEATWS